MKIAVRNFMNNYYFKENLSCLPEILLVCSPGSNTEHHLNMF